LRSRSNRSHPLSRPGGVPASRAPASDCGSRPDERDRYQCSPSRTRSRPGRRTLTSTGFDGVRGGQGDQACSYATSRAAHAQPLGENAWNDGELRGPQAGGRRQLADQHADATLLVNAAGFFIPGRSSSTTARSTTPTSSWTGIFTQTVARGIIEHGRGAWATPSQGWRPCGEHSPDAAAKIGSTVYLPPRS